MSYRPIVSVDWLVVHTSASRPDMDIGVKEIRKLHMQNGWSDVGYHYIIRRDGTVEKGRTDTTPGAHARGYNLYSLGICLVGGVEIGEGPTPTAEEWYENYSTIRPKPENNYTPAQFVSLRKILDDLLVAHPDADILGHRDLPGVNKACPCFDVREWIATYEEKSTDEHDTRTESPESKTPNTRHTPRQKSCRRHRRGRTYRV